MENAKIELDEVLDQVTGGTDATVTADTTSSDPFADLPRVTDHKYTTDVTNRA